MSYFKLMYLLYLSLFGFVWVYLGKKKIKLDEWLFLFWIECYLYCSKISFKKFFFK